MNLIICLDDNKGMLFNNRRQSRDSVVTERVLALAEEKKLLMNSYSAKLFPLDSITVDEDFLLNAESVDFCFAEQKIESLEGVNALYLFLWNRKYPSDVKFGFDLKEEGFSIDSTEEFVGSSHEKITLEVYRR